MKYKKLSALIALLLVIPGVASASNKPVQPARSYVTAPACVISAQEKADYAYIVSHLQNDLAQNSLYEALIPESKEYFVRRGAAIQYALTAVLNEKLTGNELNDIQTLGVLFNTVYIITEGDAGYQAGDVLAAGLVGLIEQDLLGTK